MAPNLMPPVIKTLSEYKGEGKKIDAKIKYAGTEKHLINTGMEGRGIVALVESSDYNLVAVASYITTVLRQLNIDHSYGTLAGVQDNMHKIIPTLIFGPPGLNCSEEILPVAPYNLPLLIRDDYILRTTGFGTTWCVNQVSHTNEIMLELLSLGLEGNLMDGGSLAGFLSDPANPNQVFGLTAAHCVRGARPGMAICSPCSLEITSRLDHLMPYTNFAPTNDQLGQSTAKESEAGHLIQQYHFQEADNGVTFLDRGNSNQTLTGVFSGPQLGTIVARELHHRQGLLHQYDQGPDRDHLKVFEAEQSWQTRLDWCIFFCLANRCGGNIYQDKVVNGVGDLYPGATVVKIGRSTGMQVGQVNRVTVQEWHSDMADVTHEIAIMRMGMVFATTGDSGGCVLVKEDEIYKAAGMLIGRNKFHELTLATPLRLILNSASPYQWA